MQPGQPEEVQPGDPRRRTLRRWTTRRHAARRGSQRRVVGTEAGGPYDAADLLAVPSANRTVLPSASASRARRSTPARPSCRRLVPMTNSPRGASYGRAVTSRPRPAAAAWSATRTGPGRATLRQHRRAGADRQPHRAAGDQLRGDLHAGVSGADHHDRAVRQVARVAVPRAVQLGDGRLQPSSGHGTDGCARRVRWRRRPGGRRRTDQRYGPGSARRYGVSSVTRLLSRTGRSNAAVLPRGSRRPDPCRDRCRRAPESPCPAGRCSGPG